MYIYIRYNVYIYEQCFSLSACGARQMTEEWGELAFYTQFWAALWLNAEHFKLSIFNTKRFKLNFTLNQNSQKAE